MGSPHKKSAPKDASNAIDGRGIIATRRLLRVPELVQTQEEV